MRARLVIGSMALSVFVLSGCLLPDGGTPHELTAVLEVSVGDFPARPLCDDGCSADTTVSVTNTGDAPTVAAVEVTAIGDDPSTAEVLPTPSGGGLATACVGKVLGPGETCVAGLLVGRPPVLSDGGTFVNDPGVASGEVSATNGGASGSAGYSVTISSPG